MASGIDARRGYDWARTVTGSGARSPIAVYSLLLATFLGTMGLPHILVRFYTNRDGPAARRTTVRVLGLLAVFYLFPPVYGGLGRALVPQLYVTGQTDSVVLELPKAAWPGLGGEVLAGVLAAGAFAAFMSTSSGLVVSIAGSVSHDLWPGRTGVRLHRARFRVAAVLAVVLPMLLALSVRRLDISVLVGWAFALAASTFCPLFLLGIWWSRLTARAAAVGMAAGGTLAVSAVTLDLVIDPGQASTLGALLAQPAVLSVPVAFACMVGLSLAGVGRSPRRLQQHRLALHAPEGVGLSR
jgi:Na+(H+)/acetate symporter ActP